jgi:signal peptidase
MTHLRRIASAALTLAVVVAAVVLWPAHLGGSTRLVLVSGTSMEPTYLLGDVVVVRSKDRPEVGDVVVFAIPEGTGAGQLVIHRIVDTDAEGRFITQGDNRDTIDQWPLAADDIAGTPILRLPYAGRLAMALGRFPVTSVGLGLIATVVLWPRRRHDEELTTAEPGGTEQDPSSVAVPTGASAWADDPWAEFDALLGLADERSPAEPTAARTPAPMSAEELLAQAQAWVDEELARTTTSADRAPSATPGDRPHRHERSTADGGPIDPDDDRDDDRHDGTDARHDDRRDDAEEMSDAGHDHDDTDDRDHSPPPSSGSTLPRRQPRRRAAPDSPRPATAGPRASVRTAWERLAERPLDELRFG